MHRSERRCSNTSKAFKEILIEAKKLSNWIWERSESNNLHEFTVITDQVSRYKEKLNLARLVHVLISKKKKSSRACANILSRLCLKNSNYQIIACCYLNLHSPKTRLNIFWTSIIPVKKASKFSKKQKKTPLVSCLLNKNQFLRQMKVIKTFKNDYLANLLKEKMRNVALVEVPYPRTRFMYTWVTYIFHRIKPFLRKENFIFVRYRHA